MSAPETARVEWGLELAEDALEGSCGGDPERVELGGLAAIAFATGKAPKPVVTTSPRASSGFLIRDLQDFWSHRGPLCHAYGTARAQHAKRKNSVPVDF